MRGLLAVVPVVALLAGCASAPVSAAGQSAQPTAPATVSDPMAGCAPSPKPTSDSGVTVDYADFVQSGGVTYTQSADGAAIVVTAADAGPLQFKVGCSLGTLNQWTHRQPPPARDGDASYLPSGTPVYAQKGWPTSCRLLANSGGLWLAYVARSTSGEPIACHPSPGSMQNTVPPSTTPQGTCHSQALPPGQTAGEPDFVDFLIFGGQLYKSDGRAAKDPGHSTVQFHVRCEFGAFSDSLAGSSRSAVQSDGDAAFLPVGTPVYAINGSSPLCLLAVKVEDGWHIYTANGPGCATPTPIATAVPTHS